MVEEEKMSSGRGIPRRAIDDDAISPAKVLAGLKDGSWLHQAWPSENPLVTDVGGNAPATGATGDFNFIHFGGGLVGNQASYHIKGAGQTILNPTVVAATGLLSAGLDVVAAEGVEYIFGGLQTDVNPLGGSPLGTRGNHFIRHKFQLGDASEAAECAIGFRGAEAAEANLDDYTDLACLNIQAGVVNVETIVGGAATVTTPIPGISAVADDDVLTCEVQTKGAHPIFIFTNHTQNESAQFEVPVAEDLANDYVPFAFFLQGAAGCLWPWHAITCGDVADDNESLQF